MINTGASCSLMDIDTIGELRLNKQIDQQARHHLIHASGNSMKIIVTVNIDISLGPHIVVNQNVTILNVRTYKHVLLDRDFLFQFRNVEFYFLNHNIRLGKTWFNCVKPREKAIVMLDSKTS